MYQYFKCSFFLDVFDIKIINKPDREKNISTKES